MSRILSHSVVAAVALVAGGAAAIAFSTNPERPASAVATRTLPAPPDEVKTVVVTKTIRRVRHVKVRRHVATAAPAPTSAPAASPARVAVAPRRVVAQAPAAVPSRPVTTRTSGHAGGGNGEHEHEGGGDD